MTVKKLFIAAAWLLVLSMTLCGCDMDAMMEGFPFYGSPKEAEDETTVPTTVPPTKNHIATVPTEAPTEAPTEPELELYWVCAIGGLNVRSGPDTGYSSVGSLDDGLVIEPVRWSNGWAYIQYPISGWCSGDFLHPLGWYKDVKLPVGQTPQDRSLVGKWVHTTPAIYDGSKNFARAGVFEFHDDGTFSHSVATYISYYPGNWALNKQDIYRPQWLGEYRFDGKTLVLNYTVYVSTSYDNNGQPVSREWLPAGCTVTMEVTMANDRQIFYVPDGSVIPCYEGFASDWDTGEAVFRASASYSFPDDVCAALAKHLG